MRNAVFRLLLSGASVKLAHKEESLGVVAAVALCLNVEIERSSGFERVDSQFICAVFTDLYSLDGRVSLVEKLVALKQFYRAKFNGVGAARGYEGELVGSVAANFAGDIETHCAHAVRLDLKWFPFS